MLACRAEEAPDVLSQDGNLYPACDVFNKCVNVNGLDDHSLIETILQGHPQGFDLLVERYASRLYRQLRPWLSCREDVEDVIQTTFLKAFQNIHRCKHIQSIYPWLLSIGMNLIHDMYRQRQRRQKSITNHTRDAGNPGRAEEVLEAEERRALVLQAIEELPMEFRIALQLREWEDLDYQTIAQITGVPVGTVRSRIHRAREMLLTKLQSQLDNL